MTITVNHPVLGAVQFPDTATPEQINDTLLKLGADLLPEDSSGSVFFNQLGEGISSSFEGLAQATGLPVVDTYEEEFRNRVQLEQSPYAGYGGLVVGSLLDPVTLPAAFLKPLTFGSKVATGMARGGAGGAFGGLIDPVYDEFGDSRIANTVVGSVFGAGLGGGIAKLFGRDAPAKATTEDAAEDAIQSTAESLERRVEPEVDPVAQAQKDLEIELTARSKQGLTKNEAESLEVGINERLARVEQIEKAQAKRTKPIGKGRPSKEDVEGGKAAVDRFETIKTRLMDEVREMRLRLRRGEQGRTAGAELAKLRTGQLDKLAPETVTRFDEIRTQYSPEPIQPVQPTIEPTAPQAVSARVGDAEAPAEEFAPLRTGLEPRTAAGSAGVRPEQQFAQEAAEGVDEVELLSSAWSRKNVEPARDVGFELQEPQLQRQAMREAAATKRIEELKGHKFGPYTFAENPQMMEEVKRIIGEDYDTVLEWMIDAAKKGRVFSAYEQRLLEPLRAEAEKRIATTYQAMRKMRSAGGYRSTTYTDEEYAAVMDLQFYSYIADIIDTNGTRASHALKEIQNIKANRSRSDAKAKANKPIDDIFGVKC